MIGRITDKVLPRIFTADVMALILLVAFVQAFASGIASSLRGAGARQATYFFWVCLAALLIAITLHRLRLNGLRTAITMTVIGIAGLWILGARLASPLFDLGSAILSAAPQVIPALREDLPIDTTAIANAWRVVAEASGALGLRIQTWLMSLRENVTVNDALIRNLAWTLIVWLMAAWTGWFAGRRNAVAALMPPILLLAFIISYSGTRFYTLWQMVSILLLLMGIWHYKQHTLQWERKKVDYSDSIRYDLGQAVIFLTIVIGAITFVTPSVSWREIRDFLRERNPAAESEAADLLGLEQRRAAGQSAPKQKPSLPRDHLLSGGAALSEDVVMIIRTGELPPIVNPSMTANAPRHYWRSTTYDIYVGAGWMTGTATPIRYKANTPLIPGLLKGYRSLHLNVEMMQPEGKLFWSGLLFSADTAIRADWRVRPQTDLFIDQTLLLQADMFAAASNARAYKAESYIPRVTVAELRAASTEYPSKILERYGVLPSSVPERVRALAREITRGKTNAYDKAKAIEFYLRQNYPYDLEVPAPPEGMDVADYFLFDLKKGYCDYYATAMVVLTRASGIPARFVSGYSSGSYDAANAEYVVREKNAHSWAEVYFPEIGWVEFEPTASEPEVELAPVEVDVPSAASSESAAARLLLRFRLERAIYWLSPMLVILFGFLLYFSLIERWWYLRLEPATAITKMYQRLYRLGRPLAGERARAETASEFRHKLVHGLEHMQSRSRFSKWLSGAQQDIELLTDLYQDALFSDNALRKHEARQALSTWKHLRVRLLIARANALLRKHFKVSSP